MDCFFGKIYRKDPYLTGKSMVSCNISLKPIQSPRFGDGNFQRTPGEDPGITARLRSVQKRWDGSSATGAGNVARNVVGFHDP